MTAPAAQQLALACGVAGAYVDVTDDMVTDSINGAWGRTSGFSDTRPGVFSFDLVNDTGKYTPGNTASTLSTPVQVGMGVHHIVDGMHFGGTIRSAEPYFTGSSDLSGSSKVRVVCDDMLGNAGRRALASLPDSLFDTAGGLGLWPLTDPAGESLAAADFRGPYRSPMTSFPPGLDFGITTSGIPVEASVIELDPNITGGTLAYLAVGPTSSINYPTTTLGSAGVWIQRNSATSDFRLLVMTAGFGYDLTVEASATDTRLSSFGGTAVVGAVLAVGTAHYLSYSTTTTFASGTWSIAYEFFIDGVSMGTTNYAGTPISSLTSSQRAQTFYLQAATAGTVYVSRFSHSLTPVKEYLLASATAAARVGVIAVVTPEIALDTIPSLAPAPLSLNDTSGQSALDALNDVIRSEQGYMWTETTGTLTAPVQKVKVRERTRPATVDAAHTFKISEIENAPQFTTDIENMVSSVAVRGPTTSALVVDPTLVQYVGSASDSATVLMRDAGDLSLWGQDRLLRGSSTNVRLPQFTLDALKIDRWADVSALRAGDRVRISETPSQLGPAGYIDGWLVGGSYALKYPALHAGDQMLFTFYLQPVLPDTAITDTNRAMSDGALTLTSTINASVTSLSATSSGSAVFTTGDLSTTIRIDNEVLTVSAVGGSTSPQTLTVARGATDPLTGLATVAAAHTAGALIEIAVPSLVAF